MERNYNTPVQIPYGLLSDLLDQLDRATRDMVSVAKGKSHRTFLVSPILEIGRIKKKILGIIS